MPRGRATVKKIVPKGSANDSAVLNDMFEQMTGAKNADVKVVKPKLSSIKNHLISFCKVYSILLNFKAFREAFSQHENWFEEIDRFIQQIKDGAGLGDLSKQFTEDDFSDLDQETINTMYRALKNSEFVKSIVASSGVLSNHKKYISDKQNLGDEFIKREPGLYMRPLKFTKLDLKKFWSYDHIPKLAKKYLLSILHHTYIIGYKIYELVTSPDVDIKEFSSVLISSIEKLKGQLPRCDGAFEIIANSVKMLEDNFKGYYKTSVEAENPSIIIESFIVDVSLKNQRASPMITRQFRKIIMFMKKRSAHVTDPKFKQLFGILNSQFAMMEQEAGTAGEDESDEDSQDNSNDAENAGESKEEPSAPDPVPTAPLQSVTEKNNALSDAGMAALAQRIKDIEAAKAAGNQPTQSALKEEDLE